MKQFDLSVSTFPEIPNVVLVIEKKGCIEKFETWKDLEKWVMECLYDQLHKSFSVYIQEFDGEHRYNDMEDWFYDFNNDDMDFFLDCQGWKLTRIKE